MLLKESFRYSNYLDSLLSQAVNFLSYTDNVVTKKQEHFRKKVNVDAEDETIEVPKRTELNYKPGVIIDFVIDILTEREKIAQAISVAKVEATIDIDSSISLNKKRQEIASILNGMASIKSSEKTTTSRGYKFNADGEQVSYQYDVKEVTTIDFDRNVVKSLVKKINRGCDNISNQIDKLNVELEVNYSPIYDLGDILEDAIEIFVKK